MARNGARQDAAARMAGTVSRSPSGKPAKAQPDHPNVNAPSSEGAFLLSREVGNDLVHDWLVVMVVPLTGQGRSCRWVGPIEW